MDDTPDYLSLYRRAVETLGDASERRVELFREFVRESAGEKCLQIGVRNSKCAPHWISVDLYDPSDLIDYRYDVHDLEFEDETFDKIVCNAVLEHVEEPARAIRELYRVLKKGGKIWVEVPFNQPYHASPEDYWRVTPSGLRNWMKKFREIDAGLFPIQGSPIYNGVFYYGSK